MGHVLRITDGTTTVTLTSGDMYLNEYTPEVSLRNESVQEEPVIGFTGSLATIRGNINSLNHLFDQAASYQSNQTGPRVYVEFDPGSSGTVHRSLLFGGIVHMNEDVLGWQWAAANLELEIEWYRQPFWEGPLTVLPLTNSSTTNSVTGITINNVNDSNGENWALIDGDDVDGDLPSPIKVEMYNAYASAAPADEVYIFHNVYSNPASLTHVLEGESATGSYVSTAAEGSPGSSNDEYAVIAWSTTNEIKTATLALSSAQLSSAGGGRFAVMARWNAAFPYTDMWLRLKLEGASGIIWEGGLNVIPNVRELHLLDTMRLPPNLYGLSNIKEMNLNLYSKRTEAGTHTLNLDYLMLAPISGDYGWKRFVSVNTGIDYEEYFYHDDTERFNYRVDAASNKIAEFTEYGGPILLVPNQDQKLYFMTCDNNGLALVEQSWTVKVWYRPRRSTI